MSHFVRIAGFAAVFALLACSSTTIPVPELVLEARLDRSHVEPGGEVQVRVVARNRSGHNICAPSWAVHHSCAWSRATASR